MEEWEEKANLGKELEIRRRIWIICGLNKRGRKGMRLRQRERNEDGNGNGNGNFYLIMYLEW